MKKIFSFILIAGLMFPLFGHVSAATIPTTSTGPDQKTLTLALKDIYTRLNTLSNKTQSAINQLSSNGIITDQAELDLINATTSLTKAKTIIDKITPQTDPAAFKTLMATSETSLKDARTNILKTLTDLKAALPALDTTN